MPVVMGFCVQVTMLVVVKVIIIESPCYCQIKKMWTRNTGTFCDKQPFC